MLFLTCSLLVEKKEGGKDIDMEGLPVGPEGTAAPKELPVMFHPTTHWTSHIWGVIIWLNIWTKINKNNHHLWATMYQAIYIH